MEIALHRQQSLAFQAPASEIVYGGAAGGGKALATETPIPTPTGWTTMAEIQPGDCVLDRQGRPTRVLATSDVHERPCFDVEFDDGSIIRAADDHQWATLTAADLEALTKRTPEYRAARRAKRASAAGDRKSDAFTVAITERNRSRTKTEANPPEPKIRTTAEIAATLRTARGRANHAIPTAEPLKGAQADLPIPPYTLGLWLGDGTSTQGAVAMKRADMEDIRERIERDGFRVRKRKSRYGWGILGLQKLLRSENLLSQKAIPPQYLRAATAQRVELLRGLMDADGHAKQSGSCELTTTSPEIAEGAAELIRSLGIKCHARPSRATLQGRDIGPKWRLTFSAPFRAFHLLRKAARQKTALRRTTSMRYVVACHPAGTHRVRCIQVAAPDSLFLAGAAMIPTHNSHLLRAAAIAWCMAVPGLQVYLFRRTHPELVANHLEGAGSFPVLLGPLIASGQAKIVGMEVRFSNGSKIKLCHLQNRSALTKYQGAEIHVLMFDELTHFTDYEYRYLRGRCRLGSLRIPSGCPWVFPRIVSGTNPGGIGHHWVKSGWVDAGPYVVRQMPRAEGGMIRTFIPAQVADNPSLTENDPDYVEKLEGLGDPILVRALLEGDWEIVAGSMYGDVWRPARHICRAFPIPIDWKIWAGIDDGFVAPAAALWIAQNPYTGTFYVVDELYRSGMLPEEFAERLLSRHYRIEREIAPGQTELNSAPFRGIIDSAAYNETGGAAVSRGKQMAKRVRITPCEKWTGSRVDGVQNLHRLLRTNPRDPKRGPGIVFFDHCRESIRTIPALPRDEKDPEDVDTEAEDHAFDALRYGLQRRRNQMQRRRV